MHVVPATGEHVEVCLSIERAAVAAALQHVLPQDRYPFPTEAIRSDWRSALADPGVQAFVAFESGEAVGFVSVGYGYLRTLYVTPDTWNQGVGGALHDLALDQLGLAGVEEARLWALSENHRARQFYEKRGWTVTGRTRLVPFPPYPIDVEYTRLTRSDPTIHRVTSSKTGTSSGPGRRV
jgi:GNAT superfamily N-acetyltransferase